MKNSKKRIEDWDKDFEKNPIGVLSDVQKELYPNLTCEKCGKKIPTGFGYTLMFGKLCTDCYYSKEKSEKEQEEKRKKKILTLKKEIQKVMKKIFLIKVGSKNN